MNPVPVAHAIGMLAKPCATEHHEFWPCDVSALDPALIDGTRVHGSLQLTDAYLLALAVAHRGRFVTFDRSVPLAAVHGANPSHLVVL